MCLSRTFVVAKESTEAKLQATSTWGKSTEPTKGVMKHTYKAVLYNYWCMLDAS
jgi:endo-beta-N-acetylglucosaminidase D